MPPLKKTAIQRQEDAFRAALARGKAEKGLADKEVAEAAGIYPTTLSNYRRKPWSMQFRVFSRLARKVGMTGEEVCRIVGVPYRKEDSE